MEDVSPVEEAARLGVLPRLQLKPCSCDELASCLGISERMVVNLMGRLAREGVIEEVPGSGDSPSQPSAYRLVAARRRSRNGGVQPKVGRPGGSQPMPTSNHQMPAQAGYALPAGMMPFGYAPYGQQVVYYPAGIAPYQPASQQMQAGGGPQWAHHRAMQPGNHGGGAARGGPPGQQLQQQQQQAGGQGGMALPPAAYPMHPGVYYASPGANMAPMTPQVSSGQQRPAPVVRAGSSSNGSVSSNGWGGMPLSQPAAEAVGGLPTQQRQRSLRNGGQDPSHPPTAAAPPPAAETTAAAAAAAAAAVENEEAIPPPQQQQQQQPAPAAGGLEAAAQPGLITGSDSGDSEGAGAGAGLSKVTASLAGLAAGNSSGGEGSGSGSGPPDSTSGGSSGSRRSRGGRDRQPCAFFLKTGTCAYGDSCKFAHPYDQAPKVEFNALGLPLRPGEPECSFYVKNFRCAFGHTCKFHHPELPAGPAVQMYGLQYHMQYAAASGSPMLNAVLGMHKPGGGSSGSPVMAMQAGPSSGAPQGYYLAAAPYPGGGHQGFTGRPGGMHMFPAPGRMVGGHMPRGGQHRAAAGHGGGRAAATPAAAAAAATPAAAAAAGMPAPVPLYGAGPAAGAAPSQEASMPAPIMVFNSPPHQPHKLAAAIERLQLEPPSAAAAPAAAAAAGGEMQHEPQAAAAAVELTEPVGA